MHRDLYRLVTVLRSEGECPSARASTSRSRRAIGSPILPLILVAVPASVEHHRGAAFGQVPAVRGHVWRDVGRVGVGVQGRIGVGYVADHPALDFPEAVAVGSVDLPRDVPQRRPPSGVPAVSTIGWASISPPVQAQDDQELADAVGELAEAVLLPAAARRVVGMDVELHRVGLAGQRVGGKGLTRATVARVCGVEQVDPDLDGRGREAGVLGFQGLLQALVGRVRLLSPRRVGARPGEGTGRSARTAPRPSAPSRPPCRTHPRAPPARRRPGGRYRHRRGSARPE